jgi:hypothetical protein
MLTASAPLLVSTASSLSATRRRSSLGAAAAQQQRSQEPVTSSRSTSVGADPQCRVASPRASPRCLGAPPRAPHTLVGPPGTPHPVKGCRLPSLARPQMWPSSCPMSRVRSRAALLGLFLASRLRSQQRRQPTLGQAWGAMGGCGATVQGRSRQL